MTRSMIAVASVCGWLLVWQAACCGDPNQLTSEEKRDGFKLLFNGRDLRGWEPHGNWAVQDGAIVRTSYCSIADEQLVYRGCRVPQNFELRFEWMVPKNNDPNPHLPKGFQHFGGSLVFDCLVGSKADPATGQIWDTGKIEYLFHAGEGTVGVSSDKLRLAEPISFDLLTANWGGKEGLQTGIWHQARIIWRGSVIQHWVNGVKSADVDLEKREPGTSEDILENDRHLKCLASQLGKDGLYFEIEAGCEHSSRFRGIKLRVDPDTPQKNGRNKMLGSL